MSRTNETHSISIRPIKTRWAEYFSEILNRPSPETEPDILVAVEDLVIETSPLSKEEIINAIKAMKNNKAPGPDNLKAELFKTDPTIAAEILLHLMMKLWEDKRIPDDWNEATIIRIPKVALKDCNNWRGIPLLFIPCKVLAKITINRLSNVVNIRLRWGTIWLSNMGFWSFRCDQL